MVKFRWPSNEYRIVKKLNGRYIVRRRAPYWPFWWNIGWKTNELKSAQWQVNNAREERAKKRAGEPVIEQGRLW